ncbi:hypothetical protein CFP56_001926, partial [Quercus suber]
MNGVVHWLAQTPNGEGNIRNVIVVFDIGHEVFDEMPVPKSLEGMEHLNMEVAVKTYVFLCGRDRVTGVGAEHIDNAVEAM